MLNYGIDIMGILKGKKREEADKTCIASRLSLQEILKEILDAKKKLNQKGIWIHILKKHSVLVKVIM